jgi:hypothetical protein
MRRLLWKAGAAVLCLSFAWPAHPQSDPGYRAQVSQDVEAMKKQTRVVTDLEQSQELVCWGKAEAL